MTSDQESPGAGVPPEAADAAGIGAAPESEAEPPAERPPEGAPAPRRPLTRSADDRWFSGVAGGLGDYLGIDATILRIVLVIATVLTGGVAILLYLIAWVVMPAGVASEDGPVPGGARGGSAAGIVFGALLVGAGSLWLLSELDVDVPRGDVLLAVALIALGALIVATAGRRGSGGLIALGVVLTLVLGALSAIDLRVDGAFGDRSERPRTLAALEDSYDHAFGSMTVDLRDVEFPRGTTKVSISIAFGDLRVIAPDSVGLRVNASTVFGSANVLGREVSGIELDRTWDEGFEDESRRLEIELSTTFGSADVDARP